LIDFVKILWKSKHFLRRYKRKRKGVFFLNTVYVQPLKKTLQHSAGNHLSIRTNQQNDLELFLSATLKCPGIS